MKKLTVLIIGLLAFSVYAGDSAPPTEVTKSYDASNFPPGSNIESTDFHSTIQGDWTAVALYNVLGKYFIREGSNILSDYHYGLYTLSNSQTDLSLLLIENYGNISSSIGINSVGLNGQLNNWSSGRIFGGGIGVQIDPENGTSLYNGFTIRNHGRIESDGLGIYQLNDKQDLAIYNELTGVIAGESYGVIQWGKGNIENKGTIYGKNKAAIYLINGGTVNNTGTIHSDYSDSVRSTKRLTLKGDGEYVGNIRYNGGGENSFYNSFLTLDNTTTDFRNARIQDWASITVLGGENYFNVEYYHFDDNNSTSTVYLDYGAILHTGDGDGGVMNLHISDGIVNPFANNHAYNNDGSFDSSYYNRPATLYNGGPMYYEKKEYEKLTLDSLTMGANGGLVIDIKDAMPLYDYPILWVDEDFYDDKYDHPDGKYGGWGYAAFVGSPLKRYHRINHDTVDVKGTSFIADGATLYLVDHTMESPYESFNPISLFSINAFDGNISFDDFTNIEFYSDVYGINSFDNENGEVILSTDSYVDGQKGLMEWWLKQSSLGFWQYMGGTETSMSGSLEPYQVAKAYSANITQLETTPELQEIISGFQSWDDVDAFMDSLNKLEYASLATSNLNLISNRVGAMYNRLGAGYDMRDGNNVSIWGDVYFSNDSLDGKGNHGIDGQGTEFVVGLDKLFNDKFTLGMSFNYTDYTSTVNDSGIHDKIESEGYGLNVYAMLEQGALTHKVMLGYASYENTGDHATFDSDEMFVAYRAQYTMTAGKYNIKPLAGIRYSKVSFDEMREDSENGLKAFDQDSLETELGVELSRQFKRLGVSVSGAWMHELLDSQTTAQAYTSFGDFSQNGIARDTDSFRTTIGFEYQLSNKITLDFDYAKEMSDNSESDSVNGKITFRF